MQTPDTKEKPAAHSGQITIGGDLRVNRLGFGAMRITGPGIWGEPNNRADAIKLLRRAVELGINFIDTADSYGPGVSESIIAEALYPYPNDLVIATKGGIIRPEAKKWVVNGDPKHLRSACEASLIRLKLDRIDLYQLHRIDANFPVEDQIGVLKELQAEGKIRHLGLSEVCTAELKQVQSLTPIASVQNRYNLLDRESEEVLNYCAHENIAFIPWYPLAMGQLSPADSVLQQLATKIHAKPVQLALAWLLHKSPAMLPIPGTANIKHLEENTTSALIKLDKAAMEELNNINN